MSTLAPTLQMFFTQRLLGERQASPHTVAAYRDTFRLLLAFTTAQLGKAPSQLLLTDLDVPVIDAFLDHHTVRMDFAVPFQPALSYMALLDGDISNRTVATARAPGTPVWSRFIPCFASPSCAILITPT